MYVSNVCRISQEIVNAIDAELHLIPGMHSIPPSLLEPRQVKIIDVKGSGSIRAALKEHRGTMIPVIPRDVAGELVRDGVAVWAPQSLLVYSMQDYLEDNDVKADAEEFIRATKAWGDGEDYVAVAVIGESRSPLSVCRNIVSGCQDMGKLKVDADGAMAASNTFLVE